MCRTRLYKQIESNPESCSLNPLFNIFFGTCTVPVPPDSSQVEVYFYFVYFPREPLELEADQSRIMAMCSVIRKAVLLGLVLLLWAAAGVATLSPGNCNNLGHEWGRSTSAPLRPCRLLPGGCRRRRH
jgi:hypothetical protein